MGVFSNKNGKPILLAMVKTVQDNKAYLSEVDGLIGDGDHGMNMNKGFSMYGAQIENADEVRFTEGLENLGMVLMNEIGGSMGPIYGTIFIEMAEAGESLDEIGVSDLAAMLKAGLLGLSEIVDAKVGDKTLVDTLAPAIKAMVDSENYPNVAKRVCEAIIDSGFQKRGILICGTGIGMAISANKFKGIRAAVCHDSFSAERLALSNDGNVLCMGARVIGPELAKKVVQEWVGLKYKDGPSTAKIKDIRDIEQKTMK